MRKGTTYEKRMSPNSSIRAAAQQWGIGSGEAGEGKANEVDEVCGSDGQGWRRRRERGKTSSFTGDRVTIANNEGQGWLIET